MLIGLWLTDVRLWTLGDERIYEGEGGSLEINRERNFDWFRWTGVW